MQVSPSEPFLSPRNIDLYICAWPPKSSTSFSWPWYLRTLRGVALETASTEVFMLVQVVIATGQETMRAALPIWAGLKML